MLLNCITKRLKAAVLIEALFVGFVPSLGMAAEPASDCLYNENLSQKQQQQKMVDANQVDNTDLKSIMKAADVNDDLRISVKEAVSAGMASSFVKLDRNHDKFITPPEVNLWLKDELVAELWKSFRISDRNRDLVLERLELVMDLDLSSLEGRFKEIDTNSNGKIDFYEMMVVVDPVTAKQEWFLNRLKSDNGIVAPLSFKF